MDQNWLSAQTNSALYQARLREVTPPRPRRLASSRDRSTRRPDAPRWSARLHPRRSVAPGST